VNRTLVLLICLIVLVAGWVAYLRVAPQPISASASNPPKVEHRRIYFVPIGGFSVDDLQPLVQYYAQKYKLEITIVDRIPMDPAALDVSRRQLIAENLGSNLRNQVPEADKDPESVVIEFTTEDMYPVSQGWQFAFGWRLGRARTAVVSTARLSLTGIGQTSDHELLATRLRKIVTKDLGILYFGLPQSENPKSVLYNQIMGIEELDAVGEDF
jgi:predicted Zn-dependent protease